MVNAQEWLDKWYPKNERKEITRIEYYVGRSESLEKLTGLLDLSDFVNLEFFVCVDNQLTSLNVNNCPKLKEVKCLGNNLTSLDFSNNPLLEKLDISENYQLVSLIVKDCPKLGRIDAVKCQLTSLDLSGCNDLFFLSLGSNWITNISFLNTISHPEKLKNLTLSNNHIKSTTLDIFSRFTNLKTLAVGNDEFHKYSKKWVDEVDEEVNKKMLKESPKYRPNYLYNGFYGSLKPLQNLIKLESLCIEGTDIDSGLEYLPNSLNEAKYDTDTEIPNSNGSRVYCSPKRRPGSKVGKIKEQLKPFNYNLGKWKENYRKRIGQEKGFYSAPTISTEKVIISITVLVGVSLLVWLVIKYRKKKNKY